MNCDAPFSNAVGARVPPSATVPIATQLQVEFQIHASANRQREIDALTAIAGIPTPTLERYEGAVAALVVLAVAGVVAAPIGLALFLAATSDRLALRIAPDSQPVIRLGGWRTLYVAKTRTFLLPPYARGIGSAQWARIVDSYWQSALARARLAKLQTHWSPHPQFPDLPITSVYR